MMHILRPTRVLQIFIILALLSFITRFNNIVTSDAFHTGEKVGSILQAAAKDEAPENTDTPKQDDQHDQNKEDNLESVGPKMVNTSSSRNFTPSEIELLQSLSKRREELVKREKELATREALLKAAENQVDRKIAEMKSLRTEMEKLLNQQQKLEEERLASLVKVYENMKPKDAASIFNTMDMDILIQVMGRMSERKMAPILASMNQKRAQDLTIRLAEEHQLPKLPE